MIDTEKGTIYYTSRISGFDPNIVVLHFDVSYCITGLRSVVSAEILTGMRLLRLPASPPSVRG